MSHWVRLWGDMPTDPKWRVIARRSNRPISEVIAVFTFMLTHAGSSTVRGSIKTWDDEDVAAALDTDPENISAIREAMQGKILDGDRLQGWDKRQPKREDDSANRVKEWRKKQAEAKKLAVADDAVSDDDVTQCNAEKRERNAPDKIRTEQIREEKKVKNKKNSFFMKNETELTAETQPSIDDAKAGLATGLTPEQFQTEWRKFRDHHLAAGTQIADLSAAWRKWLGIKSELVTKSTKPAQAVRTAPVDKSAAASAPGRFYATPNSEQMAAWTDHYRQTKGRTPPTDALGGWTFPSEWPPATSLPKTKDGHSAAF